MKYVALVGTLLFSFTVFNNKTFYINHSLLGILFLVANEYLAGQVTRKYFARFMSKRMFQITFYDQKRSMILSSHGEAVSGSASGSGRWSLASFCLGSPIVWLRSTRHLPSGSLWNMNKIYQISTNKSFIPVITV